MVSASQCLFCLALAAASAPARAPIELEWSAPQGCPDRAAVLAEAQQLLGASAGAAQPARLAARGTVSQESGRFRLHLEITTTSGTGARDLEDESCVHLAQVTALSLALAQQAAAAAPEPRPLRRDPPREPPRFLIRAMLGGDLGSLREPSPGPGLAIGVFIGRARIEAVGNYWLPEATASVQDQLISGGLHGCMAITDSPELGVCVGAEGGRIQGRRVETNALMVRGWMAILAGAALGLTLTDWLALRLEASLGLTLVAPTFDTPNGGARAAAVFGRLAAGVEVQLR